MDSREMANHKKSKESFPGLYPLSVQGVPKKSTLRVFRKDWIIFSNTVFEF